MFRRSVVARLLLPLVAVAVLVVGIMSIERHARHSIEIAQREVQEQNDRTQRLTELRSTSRALQRDALNLITDADAASLKELSDRFAKRFGDFTTGLDAFRSRSRDDDLYLAEQRKVAAALADVRLLAGRDRPAALRRFQSHLRPTERRASVIADAMIKGDLARSADLIARERDLENSVDTQTLIVSAIMALVTVAIALCITIFTVLRPIQDIIQAMRKLAAGDADVPIPHRERLDAIGGIARSIEVFRTAAHDRDKLAADADAARAAGIDRDRLDRERAHRARTESDQRSALGDQRRRLSHELADLMEDRLSVVNGKLRSSASRVSRFADEMARNAADSGRNADRTAISAERVAGDLTLIIVDSNSVAQAMDALRDEARRAAEAMRIATARSESATLDVDAMASSADQVGLMAELIRSVAHKANLLALNATIEAARAGDVGLGFAVVANEMKGLARQTAEATIKVDGQVATIRQVALGARSALAEIVAAIAQIERHATQVDAAMHQHGAASADMQRGLKLALDSLDSARGEMEALGGVAADAGRLAATLNDEARLLGDDADGVDVALRQVVLHLRATE